MENDKTVVKPRVSLFFYVSFIIMLVVVICMGMMVFAMNETLKKQQEILIKVPPELNSKILAQFQSSADSAQTKIVDVHSAISIQIKKDAKQLFEFQENRLQKQMEQIISSQNQLQPELAKLNRNIESVVQASKKNHENAEAAIAMAKKAAESGEMQLAMIYACN